MVREECTCNKCIYIQKKNGDRYRCLIYKRNISTTFLRLPICINNKTRAVRGNIEEEE